MSRIDDILTGSQTAIKANASFTAAKILRRRELSIDDELSTLYIFLNIVKPEPSGTPLIADMRKYPLEVVVKFCLEGRTLEEDVKDQVNVLKGTYSDAIKTAMRTCMPFSTYPIASVYHVELASEDLEYQESRENYESTAKREFRIQQIWNLHTFESIPEILYVTPDGVLFVSIESDPPQGAYKVANVYIKNGNLNIEYDDTPTP